MEDTRLSRAAYALLTSITGVAVLTAFAAWSTPSFRKLMLFSVAYGLCVGGIVGCSAKEFGLQRLPAVLLAVLLTIAGLGLISVRGLQQYRAEVAAAAKADPEEVMARNLIEAAAAQDPELAAKLEEERRQENARDDEPSFANYLALRVRPLGEWRQPWPIVFWGVEFLLAAACSAILVSRQLRSPTTVTEQ